MSPLTPKNVLARYSPGRTDDIEKIYLHAVSGSEPFALSVEGAPGIGTSEVLRGVFDRLFRDQRFVVPFYFQVRPQDGDSRTAASRYLYEFLLQAIAFRKQDPDLIAAAPDVCELKELAPLSDAGWVSRLCEECEVGGPLNDDRAFIRSAISAPIRAANAAKFRVCVIIDDLHEILSLPDGEGLLAAIEAFGVSARSPVIIGSHRRFRHRIDRGNVHLIGSLSREDAGELIDDVARTMDVNVSEQARDLLAIQMEGRVSFIRAALSAARARRGNVDDYRSLQQIYSQLLTSGAIGSHFDEVFAKAVPRGDARRKLLEQLHSEVTTGGGIFDLAPLRERLSLEPRDFEHLSRVLDSEEILLVDGDHARVSGSGLVADHLRTRTGGAGALAAGELIANSLKRAPRLMSREYRRSAAVGLSEILLAFDLQEIPRGLIDYRVFRERVRGGNEDEAIANLFTDPDKITLPQIAHAAPLAEYLPETAAAAEPERAVAGRGFASRAYTDEDEVVWLAAEIDSKLEADEAVTREWTDRLERAAEDLGFSNFRIWLVAPEGFSQAALDHLSYINALGSSRRQAEFLKRRLTGPPTALDEGLREFELVIPIGDETELIAAHALEEIARRYNYPPKAVNQMKTALVEACINAAEHGLSPDRKIYQKFAVGDRKVIITVSNRGLRLSDRLARGEAERSELGEGRRGWGLNLIRTLMDDVRVEPVDDGTRIVMTKMIPAG